MSTPLLDDDGTASIATLLMCSHHALRRDVACFAKALAGELSRADALHAEWARFRQTLHGHHEAEDTGIFPSLRAQHAELAAALDELDAHHHAIDHLLVRGDHLFADLPNHAAEARDVIDELADLLHEHLEAEERAVIPHLRAAKEFPPPPNDEMIALYADGFAWSSAGISSAVLDHVFAMLPPALVEQLPAARRAFDERCLNAWGYVHSGESLTSAGG